MIKKISIQLFVKILSQYYNLISKILRLRFSTQVRLIPGFLKINEPCHAKRALSVAVT